MSNEAYKFSGSDAANYEEYLGPLIFETSAIEFVNELAQLPVTSILETSCGSGRLTQRLQRAFPVGVRYTATDISGDMMALAEQKLRNQGITFTIADGQQLPFADGMFDLVVNQYGLMFFPDKQKGVGEAFRVLKPGGHVAFATWDRTTAIPLIKLFIEDHIIPFFKEEDPQRFRTPFSLHDPVELEELLKTAGFGEINVKRLSFRGEAASPKHAVNALFLKHRLGREVMEKDPAAVPRIAKALEKSVSENFGAGAFTFELSAWIAIGRKPIQS
jgi:ubiquinone/menaquinone biosynthesis C-methylase UbiE